MSQKLVFIIQNGKTKLTIKSEPKGLINLQIGNKKRKSHFWKRKFSPNSDRWHELFNDQLISTNL